MFRTIKNIGLFIVLISNIGNAQTKENFTIALTGNAFEITNKKEGKSFSKEHVNLNAQQKNNIRVYFKVNQTGNIQFQLKGSAKETSKIKVNFLNQTKTILFKKGDQFVQVGKFKVNKLGYQQINLVALEGNINLTDVIVSGEATAKGIIYSNDPNYYYWARRGPSCHLAYVVPTEKNVSYYYNEIKVDKGQDVVGSYFMANGFGEGYFGMQVNSENERRILFSVWSPFVTDDPKSIPNDEKIKLLRKGKDVYTGEFGNEGSGGQSYLKYNWKADTTYKFLLKGTPNGDNSTTYTAWFADSNSNKWNLIASFNRPKTNTYLKRFHSFLENFIPNQGYITRQVSFNNQWVYDGEWKKVNEAKLTVDATYKANQRVDATGGVTKTGYYLKMGGFFDEIAEPNSIFKFNNQQQKPSIDFNQLP